MELHVKYNPARVTKFDLCVLPKISLLFFQIFDNALIVAGLLDDPREMVGRLNLLLGKALGQKDEK